MKKLLIIFLTAIFLTGCAGTKNYRASPLFELYFKGSKDIAVVLPDIKMYKLTAGHMTELIDEWSEEAKNNILYSLREEFSSMSSLRLSFIDADELTEREDDFLKEQTGLYDAVKGSIILHTYNPENRFQHKVENFDYTLGEEISRISTITGADMLLFCTGRNYIWTAGRVTSAIFGTMLGAVTGIAVVPLAGPEHIAVSLVDAGTGDVIWFNYIPMQGDLRNPKVCDKNIRTLFKCFLEEEI